MAGTPLIAYPRAPEPAAPGVPLAELKQHLLLFVATPPGPKTFARVLEAYFDIVGDSFVEYGSTAFGADRSRWTSGVRKVFLGAELPRLRQKRHWGYSFSDGKAGQSQMLMIHWRLDPTNSS